MREELPDFPFLITWLILGILAIAVVLMIWSSFSLLHGRHRALLGCLVMVGILLTMGAVLGSSGWSVYVDERVSQRLFPLVPFVLIVGVYWLAFSDWNKS